jgi:hypothetical protein
MMPAPGTRRRVHLRVASPTRCTRRRIMAAAGLGGLGGAWAAPGALRQDTTIDLASASPWAELHVTSQDPATQ